MDQIDILKLKQEDNIDSFNSLYQFWSGKLYNFILKISNGDTFLAEDLVQDVFTEIWENRKRLDENKSFGAYICTIAKDRLINIYRHRMIETLYAQAIRSKKSGDQYDAENDINYDFLDQLVNQLIEKLPTSRRNIFILSRRKYMSNKQIAQKLNLSENTVESQLSKAITFLRKEIEKNYAFIITSLFVTFF
jgi:RNA polymerase sigma-70 factor (family 1)